MLNIRNLNFRYPRQSAAVLNGLEMELESGRIGVLLGKNGSGKTTLFRNILGLSKPKSGSIILDGEDLLHMSVRERARRIAYVPQNIRFGSLTVFDSVLLGRISHFGFSAGEKDYAAAEEVIREMGLMDLAHRNASELSGGEQQKTAIARALVQEPQMLIFDEPTGNLDIGSEKYILEEARRVSREKGITVLCSLHDLNQAMHFGDRFFFLKNGEIRYTGSSELFTEDIIQEIFDTRVQMIRVGNHDLILSGAMADFDRETDETRRTDP